MSLLDVQNLTKRFGGIVAVKDVTFKIKEGEICGLIGPNGAGKSTLLKLIMRILKPDEGEIYFNGRKITHVDAWEAAKMGISGTLQIPQPSRFLPVIATVIASYLNARAYDMELKSPELRALDALKLLGLSNVAMRLPSELPFPDLKRLEIARAIVTSPKLLLLDEPFTGLTYREAKQLIKILRALNRNGKFGNVNFGKMTMIIVEHKLSELMEIVDRVIVLNFGEIIADGDPNDVLNDPKVVKIYGGD